jgi:hypothetical protein
MGGKCESQKAMLLQHLIYNDAIMLCIAYILGLSWNYVDADFISHI